MLAQPLLKFNSVSIQKEIPTKDRGFVKGMLAGTVFGLSLVCAPMLYAQAVGGGASGSAGAEGGILLVN